MTDAELRALVRGAVSRHLAPSASAARHVPPTSGAPSIAAAPQPQSALPQSSSWQQHTSHHLYVSLVNVDDACVIEPSAPCDHCGYCKSHGH